MSLGKLKRGVIVARNDKGRDRAVSCVARHKDEIAHADVAGPLVDAKMPSTRPTRAALRHVARRLFADPGSDGTAIEEVCTGPA